MSKIFEALQKTSGEVADLTLPLITLEPGAGPDTTSASARADDSGRQTGPR